MRSVTVAILVFIIAGATASARPPDKAEMPTVKEIAERAKVAIEERRRAEEEARKDPKMDRINEYMNGKTTIDGWKPIVAILTDDNEDAKYRLASANALRVRFKSLDRTDKQISIIKKKIGNALLPWLNHREEQVRIWVHGVYFAFWPGTAGNIKFKPEGGTYRARLKAWRSWKDFLK